MTSRWFSAIMAAGLLAVPAYGQNVPTLDRSDPAIAQEETRKPEDAKTPGQDSDRLQAAPRAAAAAALPRFVVGAVRVEGAEQVPAAAFAPAIEQYLGQSVGTEELRALAGAVAAKARERGFPLATAWVPAQTVAGGVLVVRVDEGRIHEIRASGPAAATAERWLQPLATGRPVTAVELERRLLLAGDVAGVSIREPRVVREGARNVLQVATRQRRVLGRATIDNWGTSTIGPVRARMSVDVNGVLAGDDRLSLGVGVTPLEPEEYQLAEASYTAALGTSGLELRTRGYVSRTEPGGTLSGRGFEGLGFEVETGLSYPLIRSRAGSLWSRLDVTVRDSELDRQGLAVRNDRVTSATLGLYGNGLFGGGRLRTRLSVVQGLNAFGATPAGDVLASRQDAQPDFTKLALWAYYTRPLAGPFSFALGMDAQITSAPLLASEEMGLGGRSFGRGFDFREFSGDRGLAASGELRFDLKTLPRPVRDAQLYAFVDGGVVRNLQEGRGDGSLASAGAGVRVELRSRIGLNAELGVPLTDGTYGFRPSPRFSFGVSARF